MKIAIIGEKDIVLGFKPLGIETYPVADQEEASRVLKNLAQGGQFTAIYLSEDLAFQIEGLIIELSRSSNIIIIPGKGKVRGLAMKKLKRISEQALGTNLIKEEE